MSCQSSVKTIEICSKRPLYSKGGATPDNFFVLSSGNLDAISPKVGEIRASVVLQNGTALVQGKVRFQASDDGINWTNGIDLTTMVTGDGAVTGDWYSARNTFLRYIRFGVLVNNQSGTLVELTQATLTVDLQLAG